MAGMIHIDLFSTLDGVMQAPGGREEDPENAFGYGGWQAPIDDDAVGDDVMAGIGRLDALLLGRKTYDIFAAYWPHHAGDDPAGAVGDVFNAVPKYVASRGTPDLPWADSHLLRGELAASVAELRARHEEIHVVGSVEFARALVAEGLFDVLNLWVYPIVLGAGKRLFPDDGPALGLRLLEPARTGLRGAVLLRYGPGDPVRTGEMDDVLREAHA
jgi:dihydrofolate reductase